MRCDMVVALGQATVSSQTILGLNRHGPGRPNQSLKRFPASQHAPDEVLQVGAMQIPQVRQTHAVLGWQHEGVWGLHHGINEHKVALGMCGWRSKLPATATGLLAADLVRLVLERSHSARQAHDLLADLLRRHDLRRGDEIPDGIFLLADCREAFVVEAAGSYWASLECQQVRAVSDAGLIGQDWHRLSPGLAEFASAHGWCPDDGSKLHFSQTLGLPPASQAAGLKRWSKAAMLLQQQNGHIDPYILRPLLQEHFEETNPPTDEVRSLQTTIVVLAPDVPALVWCAVGPVSQPLFFPVFLDGDLPLTGFHHDDQVWQRLQAFLDQDEGEAVQEMLENLQARFDHDADDLIQQARSAAEPLDRSDYARRATHMMQTHREMFEAECSRLPHMSPAAIP